MDNFNNLGNNNNGNMGQVPNQPEQPVQNSYSYNYSNEEQKNNFQNYATPVHRPKKRIITRVIACAVCAAFISAGSIAAYKYIDDNNISLFSNAVSSKSDDDSSSPSANTAQNDVEQKSLVELASRKDSLSIPEAVDKVMPAVVGISAQFSVPYSSGSLAFGWLYGQTPGGETQTQVATATGTGIVMTSEGYIITNAHVIYDEQNGYGRASKVSIVMSDETEYEANVIGYDVDTDIAVLKIDASGLACAELGNSDDLQVGELVLAIGNPLGFELFGSVTSGIVSALNREITVNDREMTLIQTDAAINSGNSGGPLINSCGQVVGINSAKMGSTYGSASVEGLSFAIPMTQAKEIFDDIINYGYVKGRPQIGITITEVNESTASLYNMPVGLYVRSVTPNGAADLAGIKAGDIIIGVNGEAVTTSDELNKKKNEFKAGDEITLKISRNGVDSDVKVTLQEVTQGDNIFENQQAVEN